MTGTILSQTEHQIIALVQKNYPNLVITGLNRVGQNGYAGSHYFYFNARPKLDPSNPIWTSSDGRQTPVSEMVLTHVENALAKVIRNDYGFEVDERKFWITAFANRLTAK